jgi:hypothetical protein
MAIARDLKVSDTSEVYRRANRLNWELAMWLPEGLYNAMMKAIAEPNEKNNALSVVVAIRKYLLGAAAGELSHNNIGYHAPDIGKNKNS